MNVLLINPPMEVPKKWGIPTVFQPLGIAYIAAVIQRDHTVKIIDANAEAWNQVAENNNKYCMGLSLEEISNKIIDFNPDIVGITLPFSVVEKKSLEIASIVKKINKKIYTVLGGPGASVRPKELLKINDVDFIVIREGEETFPELLNAIELKKDFSNIDGIGYKSDKNEILINSPRKLISDLDKIKFPTRNLLPMKQYFSSAESMRGSRKSYLFNSNWASMITSRGCPFGCTFCSVRLVMGRKFRARGPINVVDEIEELIKKHKVKHINFEDDNLTFDRIRFQKIADEIKKRNLKFTWSAPNGIRADTLDEETVKKMKESGCRRVFVAPESGSNRVLKEIIKKNMDLSKVIEAIKLLRKYKIIVDASFVIGMPGETKGEILKTIEFAKEIKKLGVTDIGFNIATPIPGSELYLTAIKKGYIKSIEVDKLSANEPLIETPEWTKEEIKKLQLKGIRETRHPMERFKNIILHIIRNPNILFKRNFHNQLLRKLFQNVKN